MKIDGKLTEILVDKLKPTDPDNIVPSLEAIGAMAPEEARAALKEIEAYYGNRWMRRGFKAPPPEERARILKAQAKRERKAAKLRRNLK